jgi:hypothetical protein
MMKGETAMHQQQNPPMDQEAARALHEEFLAVFNRMGPSVIITNVANVLSASGMTMQFQANAIPEEERNSPEAQMVLSQLHVLNHAVQLLHVTASMVGPFGVVMQLSDEPTEEAKTDE